MSEPVRDDQGDFDDPEAARAERVRKDPPQSPKPKLLPRLVAAAEKYGIAPDEIESCETNQELSLLIDHERREEASRRRQSLGRGGETRADRVTTVSPPPPPPPADEEYQFEYLKEADGYDPNLMKEIARLGKLAKKAEKSGDDDKYEELKKEIAGLKQELAAERAANHPIQRRANAFLEKFPKLFGSPLASPGDGSPEGFRIKGVIDYVFWQDAEGRTPHNTNNPERDIAAAMKALGLAEPQETPQNGKAKTRADAWAEAGQATPTNRNGADRSGVPGGRKAAVKKAAEKMQEMGYEPGDIDDDPDDDDI